jgi:hypothetical protein
VAVGRLALPTFISYHANRPLRTKGPNFEKKKLPNDFNTANCSMISSPTLSNNFNALQKPNKNNE